MELDPVLSAVSIEDSKELIKELVEFPLEAKIKVFADGKFKTVTGFNYDYSDETVVLVLRD